MQGLPGVCPPEPGSAGQLPHWCPGASPPLPPWLPAGPKLEVASPQGVASLLTASMRSSSSDLAELEAPAQQAEELQAQARAQQGEQEHRS